MQIASFLKQFERIVHDGQVSQNLVCEVLFQNLRKEFTLQDIKVSKGILYVNKDVFIKNAILFQKEKILSEINKVSKTPIVDIK